MSDETTARGDDRRESGRDEGRTGDDASGSLEGGYEAEDLFADPEPWHPIETKLVVWSLIAAGIALLVFGTLVNVYLLD